MFRFTLGVEEEFQIVDPEPAELRSHVSELLASSAPVLGDQIKRELHQSIVEVGTKICEDVCRTARGDLQDPAGTGVVGRTGAGWRLRLPAPIRSPTGRTRCSRPASATTASSRSCSSWRGRS